MIRFIYIAPALLLFVSCMAGGGPAPVEFKGANPQSAEQYQKAVTPMDLPIASEPQPEMAVTETPAPTIPVDSEALSEADELDMLDVEPQSTQPTENTLAEVDLQPDVNDAPPEFVSDTQVQPIQPEQATGYFEQEIVLTRDRPGSIKVQTNDTLFSLSEKYQVALQPLIDLNNLREPYALNKGQTLKLPPPLHYKVLKGDTLYSIARRYNIHFSSLASINGIDAPFIISPSSILVLPALARDNGGQWKAAEVYEEPVASKPQPSTSGKPVTKPTAKPRPKPRAVKPAATSTFIWPIKGKIISHFGGKAGGMRNDGINIAAEAKAEIVAAGAGTVIYSGAELKNFGRLILIRHNNGWVTAYAHNSVSKVLEGAVVTSGQVIALAGSSGSVAVPQLHFETRKGVKPVNPLKYLPKI
ncbi:MAG: peptidoglycan DD-metalloendopeptidase family protein [Robiginitomaculum sp.]|nr:peptidoglycan DD-metalloendopeptidase family protein [Robiginitomaculum sp.]